MKALRSVSLVLLGGWGIASALGQPAGSTIAKPATKHCLWEVKGASNTVFLLGSMHVMKDDMYPLAPEIEAAYRKSGGLVFETDIKAVESPALAMKLMAQATYPEGESLKKNIAPATYSLLVSNLQSSLLGPEMVDRFKPWMAAMTVVLMELQKQGFNVQSGLDRHFHGRAETDQKSIQFFEPPEFQIGLLTGMGDRESEEFLGQALRDLSVMTKEFARLAAAWKTGDTKALDELILESFREYPLMHKKFLLDRNQAWVPKLEKLLAGEKDVLVVVGAGHMIGKGGVVDLLTAKGFKVEQR